MKKYGIKSLKPNQILFLSHAHTKLNTMKYLSTQRMFKKSLFVYVFIFIIFFFHPLFLRIVGQQIQIKPPHFWVQQHRPFYFNEVPNKILDIIKPSCPWSFYWPLPIHFSMSSLLGRLFLRYSALHNNFATFMLYIMLLISNDVLLHECNFKSNSYNTQICIGDIALCL